MRALSEEGGGGGCGMLLDLSMTMAEWQRRVVGDWDLGSDDGGGGEGSGVVWGWMDGCLGRRRQALLFWGKPKEEQRRGRAVRW